MQKEEDHHRREIGLVKIENDKQRRLQSSTSNDNRASQNPQTGISGASLGAI